MVAGLGLYHDPWTNVAEDVSLTTEWQTFTLLQATTKDGAGFGDDNSRMLFDMGGSQGGQIWIDDVSVTTSDGTELVTNGAFQVGIAGWDGETATSANIASHFEVAETLSDNAYDVNLSQVINVVPDESYIINFRARSSVERTIVAGIGLNHEPWTNVGQLVHLTSAWQTFTLTQTSNFAGVGFGDDNSRLLFDMGSEQGGVIRIDDVSVISSGTSDNCISTPNVGQHDTDQDLFGNACDVDDDNDGVLDEDDAFPLDEQASMDSDGDGLADEIYSLWEEISSLSATVGEYEGTPVLFTLQKNQRAVITFILDSWPEECSLILDAVSLPCSQIIISNEGEYSLQLLDSYGDGGSSVSISIQVRESLSLSSVGTILDLDDDNDGVPDSLDAFPLDASESMDSDLDGIGNNADAFPFDSSETIDSDLDGIGDNSDTDDDNDGVDDLLDAFPLDNSETIDSDKDGIGNNADEDDDNDGFLDSEDSWPIDYLYAEDKNVNELPDEWEARYSRAVDLSNQDFDWDND
jgi:hypothetical protein